MSLLEWIKTRREMGIRPASAPVIWDVVETKLCLVAKELYVVIDGEDMELAKYHHLVEVINGRFEEFKKEGEKKKP